MRPSLDRSDLVHRVAGVLGGVMLLAAIHPPEAHAEVCGVWSYVSAPTPPSPRAGSSAIYDPVGHRTILFGGSSSNDLWQYTATTKWTQLAPMGTPPSTGGAPAVYDAARNRMLVLMSPTSVFSLDLTGTPTWSTLAIAGTPPSYVASCVYDPVRDAVIMPAGAVWSLELSTGTPTWTNLGAPQPSGVSFDTIVFDSLRERIVGFQSHYGGPQSLWALDLAGVPGWVQLHSLNGLPPQRDGSRAVYDAPRDRMLIFGGEPDPYGGAMGDTWVITFHGAVTSIDLAGQVGSPGTRAGHVLVYNSDEDETLLFGGYDHPRFPKYLNSTYRIPFGFSPVVDAAVVPAGSGTVTGSPDAACGADGSTMNLSANPASGWAFTGWTGDAQSPSTPLALTMHGYQLVVAHFSRPGGVDDGPYLNLSWDDCGTHGSETRTFACNVNTGPSFSFFGSFVPPTDVSGFLGMTATLSVLSSSPSLPEWWKFGTGFCRDVGGVGLTTGFDFTAGPADCFDPYFGMASGGFSYDVGFGGADRARLRIQCAVPADNAVDLAAGVEYGLFRVNVLRSKTTGSGSCSGCAQPVTVTLDEIQLWRYNEEIGTIHGVRDRNYVRWQNAVAAVDDPAATSLALTAARWETDRRSGRVAFTLPRTGSATLDVFDVSGRRRAHSSLDGLAAGAHEVRVRTDAPLAAGVYFVRLSQGREAASLRSAIDW